MKVISIKPRGQRLTKCRLLSHKGKKHKRPFWIEPIGKNWWFDLGTGDWVQEYNGKGGMTTSYYAMTSDGYHDVYSLKAVKRLVSKWDVPKGTKFKASLPYIGYDFTITKP